MRSPGATKALRQLEAAPEREAVARSVAVATSIGVGPSGGPSVGTCAASAAMAVAVAVAAAAVVVAVVVAYINLHEFVPSWKLAEALVYTRKLILLWIRGALIHAS